MWEKILKQTGICLIIVLTLMLAKSIHVEQLNKGADMVIAQLEKNYTAQDVMAAAKKSVKAIASAPATLTNAVLSTSKESKYGKPVDQSKKGSTVSVYAVAAGSVSAVGENDKIGKFIKICHGDEAESIYGNCAKVFVKDMEKVKKGQIIATFHNDGIKEFYYSLSKLK